MTNLWPRDCSGCNKDTYKTQSFLQKIKFSMVLRSLYYPHTRIQCTSMYTKESKFELEITVSTMIIIYTSGISNLLLKSDQKILLLFWWIISNTFRYGIAIVGFLLLQIFLITNFWNHKLIFLFNNKCLFIYIFSLNKLK